ncbi:LysE family translocator [Halopseudomonas salegens]|uniref:Threonine/homoserine/homoserine lactone efflux protein n=1 Tax=Halopseudomonas salegens TaxID=1434072 RepID=A0A1H2F700_9GAMM|nr:LysE family translocator [Halopseudomonas salegens]SDU03102.1 Threonine/homoserine/homoserine lactone efflux protein [Halopseudomonas salegens]
MSFSLWLTLVAVCALGAATPGPSLALVLRHTLQGGRSSGIAAALAHALSVGVYALLTVLGLGALLLGQPWLFKTVTLLGGAYLFWIGFQALQTRPTAIKPDEFNPDQQRKAWRDGFLVGLGNPKLILFFLALFSQFVSPELDWHGHLLIILTVMLIDAGWYLVVAVVFSHARFLPWLERRGHWFNRFAGLILIGLALRLIVQVLLER